MLKILSLDGGPGPLMQLRVIQRLQQELDDAGRGSFLDEADLFAGTSDGGLMSLYFAKALTEADEARERGETPKSATEIIDGCIGFANEYAKALAARTEQLAQTLLTLGAAFELTMTPGKPPGERMDFARGRLATFAPALANSPGALAELWGLRAMLRGRVPINEGEALEKPLRECFGDWTLGRLRKKVCILSFDTTNWTPRAYRNFGAADAEGSSDRERDLGQTLVSIGMSTASMPFYLPVFSGQEDRGYLDGVFAANNPAMSALTLAIRHLVRPTHGDPCESVRLLSMGVTQTTEEANMERHGGLLALIALLLVDDRDARLAFSVKRSDLARYLTDPAFRRRSHQRIERRGVGGARWGWLDYLSRPTFVANMLIHGMNGEATRQCRRLLGDGFHRHEPRINLARTLFRAVFLRLPVDGTDLPWNARRCFRDHFDDPNSPPSTDELFNVSVTDRLRKWLDANWLSASP